MFLSTFLGVSPLTKTLYLARPYLKAASIFGSYEFKLLQKAINRFPGYHIEIVGDFWNKVPI